MPLKSFILPVRRKIYDNICIVDSIFIGIEVVDLDIEIRLISRGRPPFDKGTYPNAKSRLICLG